LSRKINHAAEGLINEMHFYLRKIEDNNAFPYSLPVHNSLKRFNNPIITYRITKSSCIINVLGAAHSAIAEDMSFRTKTKQQKRAVEV
jgi:hypothetical protein